MQTNEGMKWKDSPVMHGPGDSSALAVTGGPGAFCHFEGIGGKAEPVLMGAAGWDCQMQGGNFSDPPSNLVPQLGGLP